MRLLELHEYERKTVPMSSEVARSLVALAGPRITVGASIRDGCYEIAATSHVGTISLPELQLLIRPKIPLHNLFLMLEVGVPPDAFGADPFGYGLDRDLLPALAAFFDRTLKATVARGLLRAYREYSETLPALRGRIDVPQLVRRGSQPSPLPCRFDEYTPDIDENRLVRAAARRLLRLRGLPSDVRRSLRHGMAALDGVSDIGPNATSLPVVDFTRLNRHYQPVLRLAEVVLRSASLIDRAGRVEASTFLIDMNQVFESFVAGRLQLLLAGTLEVTAQETAWLGEGRKVQMRPDLVFRRRQDVVYVADTKYKISFDGTGRSGDYYQLLAYVTALDLPEGALIYCQSDSLVTPTEVHVETAEKHLRVFPIDLSGSREAIGLRLQELADWLVTRSRTAIAA
jgi:5-methylcytosine-specific restriction enzyme subunit McrC